MSSSTSGASAATSAAAAAAKRKAVLPGGPPTLATLAVQPEIHATVGGLLALVVYALSFCCGGAGDATSSWLSSFTVRTALLLAVLAYLRIYKRGGMNKSWPSLRGKVAIVTGANTGVGKQTALQLAKLDATVVLACRSVAKGEAAVREIVQASGNTKVEVIALDLSSFASVRKFAAAFKAKYSRLDLLINNAGVMMCPYELTTDGFELQLQSNHLSHFLLTGLLIPELKAAAPGARVVNVASNGETLVIQTQTGTAASHLAIVHDRDTYDKADAYGVSKLANVQFTYKLQEVLAAQNAGVSTYSAHPGFVQTELGRHFGMKALVSIASELTARPAWAGAQTSLHCALSPAAVPGRYHADCRERTPQPLAYDRQQVDHLWTYSLQATGLTHDAFTAPARA